MWYFCAFSTVKILWIKNTFSIKYNHDCRCVCVCVCEYPRINQMNMNSYKLIWGRFMLIYVHIHTYLTWMCWGGWVVKCTCIYTHMFSFILLKPMKIFLVLTKFYTNWSHKILKIFQTNWQISLVPFTEYWLC